MALRDKAINERHKGYPWDADSAFHQIEQLGIAYATADASMSELEAVRECMAHLFQIAAVLVTRGPSGREE
jgi:hypothetical protein